MAHKLAHNISVHRTRWVYELSMVRMSTSYHCIYSVSLFFLRLHPPFLFFLPFFSTNSTWNRTLFNFLVLRKSTDDGISSWDWKLKGDRSTYHALFPRAWTVYDGNDANYFWENIPFAISLRSNLLHTITKFLPSLLPPLHLYSFFSAIPIRSIPIGHKNSDIQENRKKNKHCWKLER